MSVPAGVSVQERLGQLQGQIVWSFRLPGHVHATLGKLTPAMQLLHLAAPHRSHDGEVTVLDAGLLAEERKMAVSVQTALEAGLWAAFEKLEPAQRAYVDTKIAETRQREVDHGREAKASQVRYDAHVQEQARLKQEAFDRAHAPCQHTLTQGPRKGLPCGKLYKISHPPSKPTCTQHRFS